MFIDPETGLPGELIDQRVEVIAIEVDRLTAGLAQQKVLMTFAGCNKSLATRGLVDTLNQMKFFEFFQSTIYRDQSQGGVFPSGEVEHFQRRQGMLSICHGFYNGVPRAR